MKIDNYKIRLNVKSCCLYEQIFGKNFLKMTQADDMFELLYCCVVANNEKLMMTFDVFKNFVMDNKIGKWVAKEYERISEFNAQIKRNEATEEEKTDAENEEELTMTNIAAALIVRYGIDAHYVMYEMDLWEIQPYLIAADAQRKMDLVTQRFWTYLTIAPHIDGKKIKSPEDLVPFEWEKKNEKKMDFGATQEAAVKFLMGRIKQENNE